MEAAIHDLRGHMWMAADDFLRAEPVMRDYFLGKFRGIELALKLFGDEHKILYITDTF